MPYKDRAAQAANRRKWRQENLFEVRQYDAEYEATRRARPDEYHVQRKTRRAERYREDHGPTQFVGCDGEGMGVGADHNYYVWRMGGNSLVTGQPLESRALLEFIAAQPKGPIYVIYSGTYDFTMILRGAPHDFLRDLLDRAGRTDSDGNVRSARWGDLRVDYIPRKRLRVGRGSNSITVHDVFGFFQGSFVKALEEWDVGTTEERGQIASGKLRRGNTDVLSPNELAYNERECDLLAEVMTKLNQVTNSITLSASPYEGAGAIASSLFSLHMVKPIKERNRRLGENEQEPENFREIDPAETLGLPTWDAYYGGRFEITAHGPVRAKVWEYDINSAYPAVITNLPCLLHGKWVHNKRGAKLGGPYTVGHIRWRVPMDRPFGPLPHRDKAGRITFPARGSGWYWAVEWPSDPEDYTVDETWSWVPNCEHRPFSWVADRYRQRKAHKAAGRKGQAMMLKLGYNSLYGKMAQNIGKPRWRNSVYAGLVTATCRRQIRDAAEQAPADIIMFATDGIYSLSPLDLPVGDGLGEWEATEYPEGLFLVRPGIYFENGGDAKVKSRGVGAATISANRAEIEAAFDLIYDHPEWLHWPPPGLKSLKGMEDGWNVPLRFNGLITLTLAWAQNHPERAGYFGTLPHKMSYSLFPKRYPLDSFGFRENWRDGILRSAMPWYGMQYESVGYGQSTGPSDDGPSSMVDAVEEWGADPTTVPIQLEMEFED